MGALSELWNILVANGAEDAVQILWRKGLYGCASLLSGKGNT